MALASLDSLMKDIEENFSLAQIPETTEAPKGASTMGGDDDDEPTMVTAEQLLSRRTAPIGQYSSFSFSFFFFLKLKSHEFNVLPVDYVNS